MNQLFKLLNTCLEPALRFYVFLMLNTYGWGKMMGGQFHRKGHLPPELSQLPLNQVGSFDLCWTFFGHSQAYILFIGISQVAGAFLLLHNRTKLLGIAILLPILLNIIVVDYCFDVQGAATWNAISYLLALLAVVYANRVQVLEVLRKMLEGKAVEAASFGQKLLRLAVVAMMAFAMLYIVLNITWYFELEY